MSGSKYELKGKLRWKKFGLRKVELKRSSGRNSGWKMVGAEKVQVESK
jgi:hypothetical protein